MGVCWYSAELFWWVYGDEITKKAVVVIIRIAGLNILHQALTEVLADLGY